MYTIINNDTDLVKSLLNEPLLNVSQCDNIKHNILHYIIRPLEYKSYKNKEILKLVLNFFQNAHTPDNNGVIAYELAYKQKSGRMLKTLLSAGVFALT